MLALSYKTLIILLSFMIQGVSFASEIEDVDPRTKQEKATCKSPGKKQASNNCVSGGERLVASVTDLPVKQKTEGREVELYTFDSVKFTDKGFELPDGTFCLSLRSCWKLSPLTSVKTDKK